MTAGPRHGPRGTIHAMSRAVVATAYGGPEVLEVVQVDPGAPGPGRVLLEVRAAGVNPADWKGYSGAWGTDPARLPVRLGHETAGVVRAVGDGVAGISVGDEVVAHPVTGAYADLVVVPAAACVPRPADLPWPEAGALLLAGTTGAHLVTAAAVRTGDTVVVHGASGGVGSIAVQLACRAGARVLGTAGPGQHAFLRSLGAEPLAYGAGLEDRLRALAPDGITAALDAAGTDEALDASVALVADRSRVVTVAGFDRGHELGVQVLGGRTPDERAVRAAARRGLLDLAVRGELVVRVGATYALADAAQAHRDGQAGGTAGKLVLLP